MFEILRCLPKKLKDILENEDFSSIEEIRLRLGKPVVLEGRLKRNVLDYIITKKDIDGTLERMCEASVYAFIDEIRQGFITLAGGHRVGLVGRAVLNDGNISNITYISALNIRLAKELLGISINIIPEIKNKNTLIISPPNAGKTTLLRDIARVLSANNKVGLVDERGEIASSFSGLPQFDVGPNTDVFDLCPKPYAISMLTRSMSPDYIVVDEIGDDEDFVAIKNAKNLGLKIIATAHGADKEDIFERFPLAENLFDAFVVLKREKGQFIQEFASAKAN